MFLSFWVGTTLSWNIIKNSFRICVKIGALLRFIHKLRIKKFLPELSKLENYEFFFIFLLFTRSEKIVYLLDNIVATCQTFSKSFFLFYLGLQPWAPKISPVGLLGLYELMQGCPLNVFFYCYHHHHHH